MGGEGRERREGERREGEGRGGKGREGGTVIISLYARLLTRRAGHLRS